MQGARGIIIFKGTVHKTKGKSRYPSTQGKKNHLLEVLNRKTTQNKIFYDIKLHSVY